MSSYPNQTMPENWHQEERKERVKLLKLTQTDWKQKSSATKNEAAEEKKTLEKKWRSHENIAT